MFKYRGAGQYARPLSFTEVMKWYRCGLDCTIDGYIARSSCGYGKSWTTYYVGCSTWMNGGDRHVESYCYFIIIGSRDVRVFTVPAAIGRRLC